jgi:hypothetical protein
MYNIIVEIYRFPNMCHLEYNDFLNPLPFALLHTEVLHKSAAVMNNSHLHIGVGPFLL